jgi:hypothetical protein
MRLVNVVGLYECLAGVVGFSHIMHVQSDDEALGRFYKNLRKDARVHTIEVRDITETARNFVRHYD